MLMAVDGFIYIGKNYQYTYEDGYGNYIDIPNDNFMYPIELDMFYNDNIEIKTEG